MEKFEPLAKKAEKHFNLDKEMPEGFMNAASAVLYALKKNERTAAEGYVFTYGQISEKTSRGKEINVETISWNMSGIKDGDNKQRLILVATDPTTGKLIGLRLADIVEDDLSYNRENDEYTVKQKIAGEILTRLKGEGIAPALDNVFLKIITMVANDYKQRIPGNNQFVWSVENANLKRLEIKKNKGLSESEEAELEAEQKRWQSVYGEGGRFGFKKTGKYEYSKVIEPQIEAGTSYKMAKMSVERYKEIEKILEECSNK